MVHSSDGRLVRARRNGFAFVSIEDFEADKGRVGEQFVIDFERARQLADALERDESVTLPSNGRSLQLAGASLGAVGATAYDGPQRKVLSGPWLLGETQREKLATEIRQAVKG
jgi:hypothetical protein